MVGKQTKMSFSCIFSEAGLFLHLLLHYSLFSLHYQYSFAFTRLLVKIELNKRNFQWKIFENKKFTKNLDFTFTSFHGILEYLIYYHIPFVQCFIYTGNFYLIIVICGLWHDNKLLLVLV